MTQEIISNPQVNTGNSEIPSIVDVLDKQKFVRDTYTNKTGLSTTRDDRIIQALQGYTAGTPINVTYYHNIASTTDDNSSFSDVSFLSNSTNQSFLKINSFELRLKSGFDFSYDADNVRSSVVGEALIYPGFIPRMGDLFIYEIEPGKLGLFKISNAPERLSIKSATSYQVSFILYDFVGNAELTDINSRVREEAYFDKQRFLMEDAALLTREDVLSLDYIDKSTSMLLNMYVTSFYDKYTLKSYKHPNGAYDPYVVEFMNKLYGEDDTGVYAQQLVDNRLYEETSLWYKLLYPNRVPWQAYTKSAIIYSSIVSGVSTRINALLNRPVIGLTQLNPYIPPPENPTDEELADYLRYCENMVSDIEIYGTYVSDKIGTFNQDVYSPLDKLLMFYLEHEVIDVRGMISLVDNIMTVDKEISFYQIPILLFFLKLCKHSIKSGTRIRLDRDNALPYINYTFSADSENYVDGNLTVTTLESKVVGLLDNNNRTVYPEPQDISYTSTGFTIDINSILAILGQQELVGEWTVILRNTNLTLI